MGITEERINIMNERTSKIGIFLIFLFALILLIIPKYINEKPKTDKVINQRKVFVVTDGVLKKYSGQASVITIPYEVTVIDDNAFKNNTVIEKVVITKNVNYIGKNAFENCINLMSIEVPGTVTGIGAGAFSGCVKLSKVKLSHQLKVVPSNMFERCKSLKTITIPNSVKIIEQKAFRKSGLRNVRLSNHLIIIGESSFENCNNLKSIIIPNSVTEIGDRAFATSLRSKTNNIKVNESELKVIYAKEGSYAQEYTKNNGIIFKRLLQDKQK